MKVLERGKNYFKNFVCQAHLIEKKNLWNFLQKKEHSDMSKTIYRFLPCRFHGPHKLLNVQSHKLLADMSSSEEKLQDDILSERDISNEERMFPEEF